MATLLRQGKGFIRQCKLSDETLLAETNTVEFVEKIAKVKAALRDGLTKVPPFLRSGTVRLAFVARNT